MSDAGPQGEIDWESWERTIAERGITLDRPRGAVHPVFADIVYPIDYGYVNGTMSTDGEEVDIFVGSASTGLVAAAVTTDHRRGDTELKLIFDCTPAEVYLVHGFLNFDRARMEGELRMRQPMHELWRRIEGT